MNYVMRHFPADGVSAIFTEAPGGGDMRDIDSDRNRPVVDPDNWFDLVKLHSDLDFLEVHSVDSVTVSHASVSGTSTGGPSGSGNADGNTAGVVNSQSLRYGRSTATHTLKTHSLGVLPIVVVLVSGKRIFNGQPVQVNTDGRSRYVSVYVTTTGVYLHEWTATSTSTLDAVSITYTVLVCKPPRSASGNDLFKYESGVAKLGFDRISSDRRYLQTMSGGSPWTMSSGRQGDFSQDGAPRFVYPDGSVYDPVPTTLRGKITYGYRDANTPRTYDPGYNLNMAYDGSFAGSPAISIQTEPPAVAAGDRGFTFDAPNARYRFMDDDIDAINTDGQLLMFLNTVHSYSNNLFFPDITKSYTYAWSCNQLLDVNNLDNMIRAESCTSFISAVHQSYSTEVELATLPDGADFFVGHLALSRTSAPNAGWQGRSLDVLPVSSQQIPVFGAESILLEAELGFARGFHLYVNPDRKLVYRLEQSVSKPINGYGTIKSTPVSSVSGAGAYIAGDGIPLFHRQTKARGYISTGQFNGTFTTYQHTAGSPCDRSDPSNYSSTYAVSLSVRFGKRS